MFNLKMTPLDSMLGWRRCGMVLAMLGLLTSAVLADQSVSVLATNLPVRNVATNDSDRAQFRKLRDALLRSRQQDTLFKSWDASHDSLQAVMIPPSVERPNLTPAQVLRLKEKLDEQKNWLFVDPVDKSPSSPLGDADQASPADDGSAPVLKHFFNPSSANRLALTNGLARGRGSLDSQDESAMVEKAPKDNLDVPGTRSVFDRMESAASKAISRLFSPDDAREMPVTAAPGGFGDVFAPPASIPMERSQADQQRIASFQDILNSSAPAPASSYNSLPSAAASTPAGGGAGDFSTASRASGFSSGDNDSGGLGASSVPTLAAPVAPNIMDYEPIAPPHRKF